MSTHEKKGAAELLSAIKVMLGAGVMLYSTAIVGTAAYAAYRKLVDWISGAKDMREQIQEKLVELRMDTQALEQALQDLDGKIDDAEEREMEMRDAAVNDNGKSEEETPRPAPVAVAFKAGAHGLYR